MQHCKATAIFSNKLPSDNSNIQKVRDQSDRVSNSAIFQIYHGANKLIVNEMDFYSASSHKQQSVDRHVGPLGHIILISSQPVFVLSPQCCVVSGEATNTNFLVFGWTQSGLKPTTYRIQRVKHANHYTTDADRNQSCQYGLTNLK
jgi:hypothetical protein